MATAFANSRALPGSSALSNAINSSMLATPPRATNDRRRLAGIAAGHLALARQESQRVERGFGFRRDALVGGPAPEAGDDGSAVDGIAFSPCGRTFGARESDLFLARGGP
jgi:hypothetical protein